MKPQQQYINVLMEKFNFFLNDAGFKDTSQKVDGAHLDSVFSVVETFCHVIQVTSSVLVIKVWVCSPLLDSYFWSLSNSMRLEEPAVS